VARCDTYDAGECTWGACELADWVPERLGNANQWLDRARAKGYVTSDQPTLGAVAVFNDASLYDPDFGHCAVVYDVIDFYHYRVREMNYAHWNRYDNRTCNRTGLLGFIIPPGAIPGAGTPPAVTLPTATADALELAWSKVQQLWSAEVDDVINEQAQIIAALRRLTGR
jgi:hypothetical protein